MSLIEFLLVGLIAGWLASLLVGGGGLLRNLLVGVIGAYVGPFVLRLIGIGAGGEGFLAMIGAATVGAVVVILVARVID